MSEVTKQAEKNSETSTLSKRRIGTDSSLVNRARYKQVEKNFPRLLVVDPKFGESARTLTGFLRWMPTGRNTGIMRKEHTQGCDGLISALIFSNHRTEGCQKMPSKVVFQKNLVERAFLENIVAVKKFHFV